MSSRDSQWACGCSPPANVANFDVSPCWYRCCVQVNPACEAADTPLNRSAHSRSPLPWPRRSSASRWSPAWPRGRSGAPPATARACGRARRLRSTCRNARRSCACTRRSHRAGSGHGRGPATSFMTRHFMRGPRIALDAKHLACTVFCCCHVAVARLEGTEFEGCDRRSRHPSCSMAPRHPRVFEQRHLPGRQVRVPVAAGGRSTRP